MNPHCHLFRKARLCRNAAPLLKSFSFIAMLLICSVRLLAQEGTVSGSVRGPQQAGLPFATVNLRSAADSNQVKGGFSGENGVFNMKNIPYGRYFLTITNIGYAPVSTPVFELAEGKGTYDAGIITLIHTATTLKGLEVKAGKRVLEKKADRFVMNVAASTYQANDLLSIFKALPFMDVERETVTINGKSNLLVLVDNVPRPKESLDAIFASMIGQDIEKIEFITNPSAQYDGTADAVINIITKKGQLMGFTGSVIAGVSQGIYANGNAGVSFTYRKKKMVINGTLNYKGGDYLVQNYGYRVLTLHDRNIVLNETPWDLYKNRTFSGTLGLQYSLSTNHSVLAQVDGNYRSMLDGTRWHNQIGFSRELGKQPDSTLVALQRANSRTNITNYSFTYKGKLDASGKKISATIIYTPLDKRTMNQMEYQNVIDPAGKILSERPVVRNTNPSNSSIVVTQADAQLPFKNAWEASAGVKLSFSKLKSDPFQELLNADQHWSLIPALSFNNLYRERVLAAYAGLQKSFGKFSFNAGVRAEKTMMKVEGVYERNFTDLFPSLLLQQIFSKDYTMAFNYKRSINRPSFVELTPYRNYLDDYTVLEGNPGLQPQYTDLLNVNAGIKNKLFIDLDYSHSKDAFSQLPIQREDTTAWKVINLDVRNYMTTISYDYRLFPWWQGNAFVRGSYFETKGMLGKDLVTNDGLAMILGFSGTFSLPCDLKLDLTFNYRTPRSYGLAESRKRSFARLALKGNLMQKKLQYTISFSDIFKDDISGFNLTTPNLNSRFYTFSDSRRIGIGLVYNFGKNTVKAAQSQKLDNEELLNRAN